VTRRVGLRALAPEPVRLSRPGAASAVWRAATGRIVTRIARAIGESLKNTSGGQDDICGWGLPLLQPVATGPPGDVLAGALDTGRLTRQVKRPIFDR
jgi:hypothetical protein